ncbi:MerR family transcriptional regulator [Clostridium paraputrificum]|uniref:MerR family transcriptional regulator n=1 Tax=Clostridium TaxID=1485 RepID=UPI003D327935
MEKIFSIGEMAKLHGISTQKLRFYDKIGLFSPEIINKDNGYRYYRENQFLELDMILLLTKINKSLEEIKEYRKNRDIETMRNLLREASNKIDSEIIRLNQIKKVTEFQLNLLSEYDKYNKEGKYKIVYEKRRYKLKMEKKESYQKGIKEVLRKVGEVELLFYGIPGYCIRNKRKEPSDCKYENHLIMLSEENIFSEVGATEIEHGEYATIEFKGKVNDIEEEYNKLLMWINKNGYIEKGDGFLLYTIDGAYTKNEDEYLTKLQVKIEKP